MSEQELTPVLRTSRQWMRYFKIKKDAIIEPAGWDRSNMKVSFEQERIDLAEFQKRLGQSECYLAQVAAAFDDQGRYLEVMAVAEEHRKAVLEWERTFEALVGNDNPRGAAAEVREMQRSLQHYKDIAELMVREICVRNTGATKIIVSLDACVKTPDDVIKELARGELAMLLSSLAGMLSSVALIHADALIARFEDKKPQGGPMICPECSGSAIQRGIGCGIDGCHPVQLPCTLCNGSGEVSDEYPELRDMGERLRKYRMSKLISMREFAKQNGMPIIEVSNYERGKVVSEEIAKTIKSIMELQTEKE